MLKVKHLLKNLAEAGHNSKSDLPSVFEVTYNVPKPVRCRNEKTN